MAGNNKKTTQTQLFMRHLQFHGYLCISPFLLSYNKFPLNPYNLVPSRLFSPSPEGVLILISGE